MVAGLAGHTHTLEDTRRIGRGTNRTGSAETVVLAVSQVSDTAEAVSFDDALEAFTFGGADDVDELAFLKNINGEDFTIFFLVAFLKTRELGEVALRSGTSLGEMATHGFVGMRFFLFTESQLNGFVAIFFDGSYLCDDTRTSFNNSARYLLTVGIKKTGHSDFFT